MATSAPQVAGLVNASQKTRRASWSPDRAVFKCGVTAGVAGVVLQLILDHLHPHQAQPNNSVAAFTEYSHASGWAAVHVGQFFGTLLIAFALLVLCRSLVRQSGVAGALASGGGVAVVVVVGVFAVQMAVDGVALKHAVDTWAGATGTARAAAFQVAEGVRWLEKGLSAFFHFMNGTALLGLGLSIVVGRAYRPWPGWVAVAAGIGFLAGGAATASGGFSVTAAAILQPSLLLLTVFLIGSYLSLSRTDMRPPPKRTGTPARRGVSTPIGDCNASKRA